jgi:hypothetical protein
MNYCLHGNNGNQAHFYLKLKQGTAGTSHDLPHDLKNHLPCQT